MMKKIIKKVLTCFIIGSLTIASIPKESMSVYGNETMEDVIYRESKILVESIISSYKSGRLHVDNLYLSEGSKVNFANSLHYFKEGNPNVIDIKLEDIKLDKANMLISMVFSYVEEGSTRNNKRIIEATYQYTYFDKKYVIEKLYFSNNLFIKDGGANEVKTLPFAYSNSYMNKPSFTGKKDMEISYPYYGLKFILPHELEGDSIFVVSHNTLAIFSKKFLDGATKDTINNPSKTLKIVSSNESMEENPGTKIKDYGKFKIGEITSTDTPKELVSKEAFEGYNKIKEFDITNMIKVDEYNHIIYGESFIDEFNKLTDDEAKVKEVANINVENGKEKNTDEAYSSDNNKEMLLVKNKLIENEKMYAKFTKLGYYDGSLVPTIKEGSQLEEKWMKEIENHNKNGSVFTYVDTEIEYIDLKNGTAVFVSVLKGDVTGNVYRNTCVVRFEIKNGGVIFYNEREIG